MAQLPCDSDLMTILAAAFHEVGAIEIGSGVVPIQVQHPTQLAQRALTLNAIAGGRFTLGIGMSHRMVTEQMWGISYEKPLRRMREYLDGLLPLLAGQAADAVGETVTTRGSLQIPGAPTPDVYIAALGPWRIVFGSGFRVPGSGFRFRVPGSGFRVQVPGSGFRVPGSGFRFRVQVPGSGFRVPGSGFRFRVPRSARSRKPEAGSRKPEAGSRKPEAGSRKPEAGSIPRRFRLQAEDSAVVTLLPCPPFAKSTDLSDAAG